ncbi:MAG TPA: phosphotransferase, partial [Actinomycetes bacterium]|nr:phosphotransferase [Actinomycetes bacterium]
DLRIRSCTPRVMRYKPGSRCTILYQLDYEEGAADPSWPDVVVAKTYHGDKGRVAWDGMRALWESPMASSGVAIAEPLAFVPELNVLVQGPIREEQTLREGLQEALRTGDPEAARDLRGLIAGTAAGLAALHTCGVRLGELLTWEDELAEVREVIDRLAASAPELGGAAEPMLAGLEAVASEHPTDPAGPAHRSFRPPQVLLSGGRLGFIDFDGFCQAEPALDVALFRATVKSVGMTAEGGKAASASAEDRLARGKELADLFLDRYEEHAPISRTRVALWESLDLFTMVLHSWTKAKQARLGDAMFMLRDHLATIPALIGV